MNDRLIEAIRLVCPVDGVTASRAGDPDAAQLQYAPQATVAQRRASLDALAAFDFSPAAQARWEGGRSAVAAVTLMAASPDPVYVTDRIVARAVFTSLNDVREKVGMPRLDEAAIVKILVGAAMGGAGAPASLPAA